MTPWTLPLPYFPEHELACKCCGIIVMDPRFAAAIVGFRYQINQPLSPTSVCRCPAHNHNESGHKKSMHLTDNPVHDTAGAAAMDVAWLHMKRAERIELARAALRYGFSVGLHDVFMHIDLRTVAGLPRGRFLYGTWTGDFNLGDL